ncbi:Acyltransferase family [Bifidobacterium animalis subsp. animalis]|uniref:acyltransferase family protein n=1 Tax=Bifidobacterium animalis TaxID=28025 RepID=UPI0010216C9E|nr:acyltransferase family protein [Bifidobacterium animalis]RYN14773.1 Acyltransferase family [Bifidobacterium animalis subsp. animalis]
MGRRMQSGHVECRGRAVESVERKRKNASWEGLRAIAIIGIVLYHMRPSMLDGGFLGVTVFFVLTGFLITRSIMRALAYGTFSYGTYMLKRLKRLVVPTLSIIVITAIAIYLASPSLLPKVQADALPGALFYENWANIFRKVSYFEAAGLPSPLTPLWFLGVTMQFYIVWPVILALLSALFRNDRRSRTLGAIVGVTCALALFSTVLMAALYRGGEGSARVYYGTDTRAAELLTGAIAAMLLEWLRVRKGAGRANAGDGRARLSVPAHAVRRGGELSPMVVNASAIVLLVSICLCFWLANGESTFLYRGGYWSFAMAVAALVVLVQRPACVVSRLLACKPLTYLGGRSFSIYLVHYPIILIMNPATRTRALSWWEPIVQLLVILAVGEVFYRLIEAPTIRFALASRVTCAVMAVCVAVLAFAPIPWQRIATERAQQLRPETAATATAKPKLSDSTADDAAKEEAEAQPEKQSAAQPQGAQAEKVPNNLDWRRWQCDPVAGTCDADAIMIGDSVTAGAAPVLQQMLPNVYIDGAVSRQLYTGQDVYAQDVAAGHDGSVLIYALGTNSLIRDPSTVQALIDSANGKPMYFVTIRCPYPMQDMNNEVLRKFAAENPNVGIIDWHGASEGHSEYLLDDGTHLTEAGQQAYGELIRKALCGQ